MSDAKEKFVWSTELVYLTEAEKSERILVTYNELADLFTEEEIYPYGVFTNKLKEFFKSKINP